MDGDMENVLGVLFKGYGMPVVCLRYAQGMSIYPFIQVFPITAL